MNVESESDNQVWSVDGVSTALTGMRLSIKMGAQGVDVLALVRVDGRWRSSPRYSRAKRKDSSMPYVDVRIAREGATPEQKAAIIRGVADLLVDTLGKSLARGVPVEQHRTANAAVANR